MFNVTVSQSGMEDIVASYKRLDAVSRDPIKLAKDELIAWFRRTESEMFSSQGSSGRSGRWAPLSPAYARQKAKKYPGGILTRTYRLRSSLTGRTAYSIIRLEPRLLTLGSRVPYATFHQLGTGKMPRRSPIDITNRDAAEVASIVRRAIFSVVKKGATLPVAA